MELGPLTGADDVVDVDDDIGMEKSERLWKPFKR